MKKPAAIQINIPNPCQQAWDDMTPQDGGRFCNSCEKTVIDFTSHTDAQLYAFLSKQKGKVCGRYLASQLNRNINIPPQPHSKLYKWFVVLGMTLVFAPVSETVARVFTPGYAQLNKSEEKNEAGETTVIIRGKVVDQNNNPVDNCTIWLYLESQQLSKVSTDSTGTFTIDNVSPNIYELKCYAFRFESYKQIVTVTNKDLIINVSLIPEEPIITGEVMIEKPKKKKKR